MPRLEVLVGPDRFHLEPAHLNDSQHPNEINTEHFAGRILVRILDAPGAREGEEGREYFKDRSRKFCIQIEGRFKKQWNGNDIHFGTDFDRFVDFPRAPFNAGMKVAKYIDPCTFYEEHPPSERPYIMSPYCACMNVLCAWPAPTRAHDAVVVLRHTQTGNSPTSTRPASPLIQPEKGEGNPHGKLVASPHNSDDEADGGDVVPIESLDRSNPGSASKGKEEINGKKKKSKSWFGHIPGVGGSTKEERTLKKYWRFVGFKDDPRVRAFIEAHHASLPKTDKPRSGSSSSAASSTTNEVMHGPTPPTLSRLGTGLRRESPHPDDRPTTPTPPAMDSQEPLVSPISPISPSNGTNASASAHGPIGGGGGARAGSVGSEAGGKPAMPRLERVTTDVRNEMEASAKKDGYADGDFKLADALMPMHLNKGSKEEFKSVLDDQLGPWRFSDPGTDMIEDNAFIFTNDSLPVPKRRKYFAQEKHRTDFVYDPDVVYGASFFSDVMNFNTFDLAIGPVRINVARFFKEMPVRYTLRAAGPEELTFATISFQLVDD